MSDKQDSTIHGLNVIGCGYDIFGKYAEAGSCNENLFDIPEYMNSRFSFFGNEYSYPSNYCTVEPINSSTDSMIYGRSIDDYTSALNTNTKLSGNYGFFSASVSTSFSQISRSESNVSYLTARWTSRLWQIELLDYDPSSNVGPRLTPAFANDLMHMEPADLFIKYGTHYVAKAIIGGRADANSTVSNSVFSSTQQLQIAAQMSYDGLKGSLSAEDKTTYKTQIDTFNMNSMRTSYCVGGDSVLAKNIFKDPIEFQNWAATIIDQPQLCDFDSESLKGIWTLCTDPDRQSDLKKAYNKFSAYRLDYQMINVLEPCGTDQGSGAKRDVSFFRPQPGSLVQANYFWVGHYAQSGYGNFNPDAGIVIIKPHEDQANAVAPPTDWIEVWGDHGSGRANDYSLWAPVPPTDYVALGHLARFNVEDYNKPSGPEIDRFVCVHKSLVTEAMLGEQVWTDQGSGSKDDGAIWRVIPADASAGVDGGTFYATKGGYDRPQAPPTVYCLKLGAVDNVAIR